MSAHRVVITGISGRFPNSDNIDELRNNLLNNVDCTTDEHDRWNIDSQNIPQRIGKCNDIDKFDRIYFGIHSKLTDAMDPMSRTLLECSFEAIMDAGINPRSLKGANVAVFNASNLSESEKALFYQKAQSDGFGIVGGSKAMIPNRISFFLGLTGTSINVDSETTGGATALECAYHTIKSGRCDAALVTGCMAALHPHVSYQLRKLGLLSSDGYTRSFDNSADGHTRSDGVAAIYLQRASDAKRIYQEVINVHSEHCNTTEINEVLFFPKIEDQVEIMKNLLRDSGLSPDDIAYLEATGMGMREADAQELEAINAVYGKRKKPLPIGSIKSVIGNAPAVSVINSIIKMIIGSETGSIPPNSNYEEPNAKAQGLKDGKFFVPTNVIPWDGEYTAVNSTSVVGYFGSIILKSPNIEKKNDGIPDDDIPRLILASGRTEEAVLSFLNYTESRPVDAEFVQLVHDVFSSEVDGHLYRGYSIVPAKGLIQPGSKKQEVLFNSGESKEIWWVYSGMGSQWAGMGETLLQLPIFEAAIRKCDAVLKPRGYDIFKVITDKDPKMFDLIINSFIGIAAIQIGLTDVLKSLGLEPDYIIGHSVGELGCAYADGCFTAEQMILAALSRGLASVETKLDRGSMAAVGLGYEDVHPLCPSDIDVACHNGPESSTISGPAESMKAFVANLTAKGIFAREVNSSNIAYHSRYIAPAGPNLMKRLQEVIPDPKPRSSKWVSSSVPRREWNTVKARLCSAEYHTNNLLSAVLFDETSRLIPANAVCIEIAPHGLLQAIVKRSLPKTVINIALTRRDHPNNLEVLLAGVGQMYNIGLQPQISNLYPKVQYPVGRGTSSLSSLVKWDHSTSWFVRLFQPQEKRKEGEETLDVDLNNDEYQYLRGNVINGMISIPLSLCLVQAWKISKSLVTEETNSVVFEDIRISKQLVPIPESQIVKLTVVVSIGTGTFEVIVSGAAVLSGIIKTDKSVDQERLDIKSFEANAGKESKIDKDDFYKELSMRGFQYSGDFQSVVESSVDGRQSLLNWTGNWVTFIDGMVQSMIFGDDLRQVETPLRIRKLIIDEKLHTSCAKNLQGVEVFISKELDYVSAGGVEIQGLKCSPIPKNLHQDTIRTDSLTIVPNISETDLSLAVSLRFILQLVIENSFSHKIQKIQIIESRDQEKFESIQKALLDIPEALLFSTEVIPAHDAKYKASLSIILEKPDDFGRISKSLGDGKFLLMIVPRSQTVAMTKIAKASYLKMISTRRSGKDDLILLRKVKSLKISKIIKGSSNIQEIMSQLRGITPCPEDERVAVMIRSMNLDDTVRLVDEIQTTSRAKTLRLFITQDIEAPDSTINSPTFKDQVELDLFLNILSAPNVWSGLHTRKVVLNPLMCQNWCANLRYSHDPTRITWTESPVNGSNGRTVKVEYAALNRQDYLISKDDFYTDLSQVVGKNRISPRRLGLEYSGVDSRGQKVMGIAESSLSNSVVPDSDWIWSVPSSWTLEDAATVPLSYLVAYSALIIKAEVEAGEKVLLSNTCNGLGLAVLHLAMEQKCQLYVTYETETEKKLIKTINPGIHENQLLKFTKGNFRDEVQTRTEGKGVDVIICNQDEVKSLERLFAVTRQNARVVLISDLSDSRIHECVGMEIFLREISLYSVVPKRILFSDSRTKKTLANLLEDGIKNGCVRPLPRIFYGYDSLQEAFSNCINSDALSKIVVRVHQQNSKTNEALAIPRLYCTEKNSYVILEGLTDFGMELIDWLISRGAKHIVIASTSKNNTGFENMRIQLWQSYGIQVIIRKGIDISQEQNIVKFFKEATSIGPIDAIFDLSRTNIWMRQSKVHQDSCEMMTRTADNLSRSCPGIRLFVICSVTNSSNHYCRCSQEDRVPQEIVQQRKQNGLPGTYIRWGLLDSMKENVDKLKPLPSVTKYLQKLDEILGTNEITIDVSCVIPTSVEVEEDVLDAETDNFKSELEIEAEAFAKDLHETGIITVDDFTQLND
ncbi:hypothetical protein QAD02_016578 [Eretmocerus hayati]|uniref:Uncharacterized protein n=1 Tax=Eretmocerus hayati TaxID=131215 RepID=A0ACC2PCU0_9HYME|nr:hypothetical protein QAD02_016578 [Eretmocerus hayati]